MNNEAFITKAKAIITTWASLDSDNIYTHDSQILAANQPGNYTTNQPLVVSGRMGAGTVPSGAQLEATIEKLSRGITWIASSLTYMGHYGIAVRVALALRRLGVNCTFDLLLLLKKLNEHAGLESVHIDTYTTYLDEIDACIEAKLPEEWRSTLPPASSPRPESIPGDPAAIQQAGLDTDHNGL